MLTLGVAALFIFALVAELDDASLESERVRSTTAAAVLSPLNVASVRTVVWKEHPGIACGPGQGAGGGGSASNLSLRECKSRCLALPKGCRGLAYDHKLRRCVLPAGGSGCLAGATDAMTFLQPTGKRVDPPALWDTVREQVCTGSGFRQHFGLTLEQCRAACVERDGCSSGFSYEASGLDCRLSVGQGRCRLAFFPTSSFHRVTARWAMEGGLECTRAFGSSSSVSFAQCQQKCIDSTPDGISSVCKNGFSYNFHHRECRIPQGDSKGLGNCHPQKSATHPLLSLSTTRPRQEEDSRAPPLAKTVAFFQVGVLFGVGNVFVAH